LGWASGPRKFRKLSCAVLVLNAVSYTHLYEIELGEPAVKRRGTDLTMVTLGPTLYTAIAAADELQARYGMLSLIHI